MKTILAIVALVATLTVTPPVAAQTLAPAPPPVAVETGKCATCKQHVSLHTKRADGTLACPTAATVTLGGAPTIHENGCKNCGLSGAEHIVDPKGLLHCPSEPLKGVTPGFTYKDLVRVRGSDGVERMDLPAGCVPLNAAAANAAGNTVVVTTTTSAVTSPQTTPTPAPAGKKFARGTAHSTK
jgi:hypothetical protein